jgi:hypothetical protein
MTASSVPRLFGSLCLASAVLLLGTQCRQNRRPSHYLIPEGYVGWVEIDYGASDAPGLPIEGGCHIVTIPPDGRASTSTDIEGGWAKDSYYYYSGSNQHKLKETALGQGGVIWGSAVGSRINAEGRQVATETFFVGSQELYQQHMVDYPREIGPLN